MSKYAEEKEKPLGFEPVFQFLPSARFKSENNFGAMTPY